LGLASAACAVGLGCWEPSPVWPEDVSREPVLAACLAERPQSLTLPRGAPEPMVTVETRAARAAMVPLAEDAKPTCAFAAVQEDERVVGIEEGCGWHLPAHVSGVHLCPPDTVSGMVLQRLPEGCLVLRTPWLVPDAVADIRGFRPCPDCDALGMPLAGWKLCR